MTLKVRVNDWLVKVTQKKAERVAKQIFKGVVKRSPVYTGSFRASWRMQVGQIDRSFTLDLSRDIATPLGEPQMPSIKTDRLKLQHIFISNSVPHAFLVEVVGTKFSPPGAVVRVTLAGLLL